MPFLFKYKPVYNHFIVQKYNDINEQFTINTTSLKTDGDGVLTTIVHYYKHKVLPDVSLTIEIANETHKACVSLFYEKETCHELNELNPGCSLPSLLNDLMHFTLLRLGKEAFNKKFK